ncbi:hypothetical protein [Pseudonocardia acaciae]|uniref:hypothetical protein n=1 Tax=Pseudonocardia acaciae TaxID=551276 RepID=UPI000490A125|nr:hypothetical protein [Pseudonocardia acaciae]
MADIQVDPALLRARANQLTAVTDGLAAMAAKVRGTAAEVEALGADLAVRQDELAAALGTDAQELALLADGLRRGADAITECDGSVRHRLSRIARGLAGDSPAGGCG